MAKNNNNLGKGKKKNNRLSVIYSFHELRIFLVLKAGYTFHNSLIRLQVDGRMQRWFSQHRQQHEVCWAQFAMWWKLNEPKTGMHQQPWATIKHHQSVELQSTGLFDFSTRVSCSISPSWVTTEAGTLWEGQPLISETIYCVFTWEDQKSQRTDKPGEGGNWTRVNLERPPCPTHQWENSAERETQPANEMPSYGYDKGVLVAQYEAGCDLDLLLCDNISYSRPLTSSKIVIPVNIMEVLSWCYFLEWCEVTEKILYCN